MAVSNHAGRRLFNSGPFCGGENGPLIIFTSSSENRSRAAARVWALKFQVYVGIRAQIRR